MTNRRENGGYWPCDLGRPRKRSYDTLDEAWLTAWRLWALRIIPDVLVPYRCSTMRMWIAAEPRIYPQKNPWRWSPPWVVGTVKMVRIHKRWDRKNACRLWHLTRSTAHMLTGSVTSPVGPGA